jgi:molybdopterin molybdotransferase
MEEALALLLDHARPVTETETLPLFEALGRVLAAPIQSPVRVPPWDNSAMDGYAVRTQDLVGAEPVLTVAQRIPAGGTGAPLAPGTAARIFTGAPIPEGADAVVIQEVCRREGDRVSIDRVPEPGANIRDAGEDIERGETLIEPGTRLQPQHLGLAASVGVAEVPVYRRLRVAIFSSGDELVMPGQPLGPGQIYNSNQFTLHGLLQGFGCEVRTLGIVEDTLEATMQALSKGADDADLIVASGGVSVGEEDHVKPAVERLGSLALWKIAIRPGKPLAFGHIRETPFIGTPGNPVSLFVTFCLFARPFILRCQGVRDTRLPALRGRADFDWPKPDKRREFVRARLAVGEDGEPWVRVFRSRSSGVLSSVAWANGLAVIPEGRILKRGEVVRFLPFSELLT